MDSYSLGLIFIGALIGLFLCALTAGYFRQAYDTDPKAKYAGYNGFLGIIYALISFDTLLLALWLFAILGISWKALAWFFVPVAFGLISRRYFKNHQLLKYELNDEIAENGTEDDGNV